MQSGTLVHSYSLYKSLFTEKAVATQKHKGASINTNEAKTTTRSITVVDNLYWSINKISYIIIFVHSVCNVYDNLQLQLVLDCGRVVTRHWTRRPHAIPHRPYWSFPANKRIPQSVTIPAMVVFERGGASVRRREGKCPGDVVGRST